MLLIAITPKGVLVGFRWPWTRRAIVRRAP